MHNNDQVISRGENGMILSLACMIMSGLFKLDLCNMKQ